MGRRTRKPSKLGLSNDLIIAVRLLAFTAGGLLSALAILIDLALHAQRRVVRYHLSAYRRALRALHKKRE